VPSSCSSQFTVTEGTAVGYQVEETVRVDAFVDFSSSAKGSSTGVNPWDQGYHPLARRLIR
jgi:hypothetical protein